MALDPRYKAVCFDMDGTFMKTKVDYTKLANVIFDVMIAMGVPESAISKESSKSELDSGIDWLKKNGREKDASAIQDHISNRSTTIEMEYANISKPFEGAVEVINLLHKKGYKTGILTRGGHSYAEYILKKSNVLDKFDAIVGRDDFPESEAKPSPQAMVNIGNALGVKPSEILYLGDHISDWQTAHDSGAGFYGVLTGGSTMKDWKDADKNIQVIDSVASLRDMINN